MGLGLGSGQGGRVGYDGVTADEIAPEMEPHTAPCIGVRVRARVRVGARVRVRARVRVTLGLGLGLPKPKPGEAKP